MKSRTKWIISIIGILILAVAATLFIYDRTSKKVFTQPEYVKEVLYQKTSFDDLMDNYLDQVQTYDSSREATERLQNTSTRLINFVSALEEKLGPKVPHVSKNHYEKMISAYKIYLEAVSIYQKSLAKNLGDEKAALLNEAEAKFLEAQHAITTLD